MNRTNSIELETSSTTENNLKHKLLKSSSTKIIDEEDDLDTALNKLEKSLDIDEQAKCAPPPSTAAVTQSDTSKEAAVTTVPAANRSSMSESTTKLDSKDEGATTAELSEYLGLIKSHKYTTFKKLKQYYFTLTDVHYLSYFRSQEESNGRPLDKVRFHFYNSRALEQ